MKWFRNKEMLNETLQQNKVRLDKTTSDNTKYLLMDYNNLIQDHLDLLDEIERLKKALHVFSTHLQIERGLQEEWLQFINGEDQSDDLTREEYELLKDVLGNKI